MFAADPGNDALIELHALKYTLSREFQAAAVGRHRQDLSIVQKQSIGFRALPGMKSPAGEAATQ